MSVIPKYGYLLRQIEREIEEGRGDKKDGERKTILGERQREIEREREGEREREREVSYCT